MVSEAFIFNKVVLSTLSPRNAMMPVPAILRATRDPSHRWLLRRFEYKMVRGAGSNSKEFE